MPTSDPKEAVPLFQEIGRINPFWIGSTQPASYYANFSDPMVLRPLNRPNTGNLIDAANRSFELARTWINPASGPVREAIEYGTRQVGEGSRKVADSVADTARAAGSGITSGFKWAVMLIFLGLAAYGFLLLAPFLPKPAR